MQADQSKTEGSAAVDLHPLVRRFMSWLKHKTHRCAKDGCWSKGSACYLPEDDEPSEWVCAEHAHDAGYCYLCGQFWGGVESFDFRRNGLCDNCDDQVKCDMGEYDDRAYEEWGDPYA